MRFQVARQSVITQTHCTWLERKLTVIPVIWSAPKGVGFFVSQIWKFATGLPSAWLKSLEVELINVARLFLALILCGARTKNTVRCRGYDC